MAGPLARGTKEGGTALTAGSPPGASRRSSNCLPGAIQVEAENDLPAHHRARPEDRIRRQCVQCRGRPEDVAAAAAAFLAGPSASFITDQSLHVDGGWILH